MTRKVNFDQICAETAPGEAIELKSNPTTQVIFDNTVLVDHTGDEKIAVRFTLWAKLPRTEHWTRCLPPGASRPKQNSCEYTDPSRRWMPPLLCQDLRIRNLRGRRLLR